MKTKIISICALFFLCGSSYQCYPQDTLRPINNKRTIPSGIDHLPTISFNDWPGSFDDENCLINYLIFADSNTVKTIGKVEFNMVGFGDSYAAGVGNPSKNGNYNHPYHLTRDGNPQVDWKNWQNRRSTRSGYQKTKNKLKEHFRYANDIGVLKVDLMDFSSGGAKTEHIYKKKRTKDDIDDNIGEKWTMEYKIPGYSDVFDVPLPSSISPQLVQMINYINNNINITPDYRLDAVLLSIGGNDVGFAYAMMKCAFSDAVNDFFGHLPTNPYFNDRCLEVDVLDEDYQRVIFYALTAPLVAAGIIVDPLPFSEEALCALIMLDVLNNPETGVNPRLQSSLPKMNTLYSEYCNINTRLNDTYIYENRTTGELYINRGVSDNALHRLIKDNSVFITEYPNILYNEDDELCNPSEDLRNDDFLRGISDEEIAWIETDFFIPLNQSVNRTREIGWNVIPLADITKGKGICTQDRITNTNVDALKTHGADFLRVLPISSGVGHPNNEGYEIMANQITKSLIPRVEEKLRIYPEDYPSEPRIFIDDNWTFKWNDNTKKETGYIVEIFKAAGGNNRGGVLLGHHKVGRDVTEFVMNPEQINLLNIGALHGEGAFDFRVRLCDALSEDCTSPYFTNMYRVGYEMPGRPILSQKENDLEEIFSAFFGINYWLPDFRGMEMIIAWAKLDSTYNESTDINDYLKNHEFRFENFVFCNELPRIPGNNVRKTTNLKANEFGKTLDLEFGKGLYYQEFDTTGVFAISPYIIEYGSYKNIPPELIRNRRNDRFVISIKMVNLAGASRWSNPIVAKMPGRINTQDRELEKKEKFSGWLDRIDPILLNRHYDDILVGDKWEWDDDGIIIRRPRFD